MGGRGCPEAQVFAAASDCGSAGSLCRSLPAPFIFLRSWDMPSMEKGAAAAGRESPRTLVCGGFGRWKQNCSEARARLLQQLCRCCLEDPVAPPAWKNQG